MPIWSDIFEEINKTWNDSIKTFNYDVVLNKYINLFSKYRNRNVIVYYSDWLNDSKTDNLDINDLDMIGFMNVVNGLDKNKGLDLIIHTPGGNPTATESIVNYLHSIFNNDIEIFVPHLAMSAGTMLACAASKIWMGKESSLGPIDPQFNGIAAINIKKEFEDAKKALENNGDSFRYWQILLSKYKPGVYYTILDALKLSSKLVEEWLIKYMFEGDENAQKISKSIVRELNENKGSHSKHFSYIECKDMGLKVELIESDDVIQDSVLSIYHCLQICGSSSNVSKIIANNLEKKYVTMQKRKER